MTRWVGLGVMVMLSASALGDPEADARGGEEGFARARGAGDVKGVMALYTDDAVAVWPGQGAEAQGKANIEKMVVDLCKGPQGPQFTLASLEAVPLSDGYIATVAHWQDTMAGPNGGKITV